MIVFLYEILYKNKHRNEKINIFLYKMIKAYLNFIYPIYCLFKKSYLPKKEIKDVIVSLTSYPARINFIWLTIETLLRQTYKPEKIILWLAKSQFKSKEKLPRRLLALENRGLTIKFCDDLGSHKKYYYVMQEYPNKSIITVDDDTFYPEDLVENLVKTHEKFPETICCNIARLLRTRNGKIEPYTIWDMGADGIGDPSDYIVPIGCEGVLYPPKCLNESLFNKKLIEELCPLADDLWLKAMSALNGVKAVKTRLESIKFINILTTQKKSLTKYNVYQNLNDKQLKNILAYYPQLRNIWK